MSTPRAARDRLVGEWDWTGSETTEEAGWPAPRFGASRTRGWWRSSATGQDRAFDEIVRRYRAPLVGFAGGIVADRHAEDVVQEALANAHAVIVGGDAEINLRPWLYTIVRNGALNMLRDEPPHAHLDENFDGVPQPPEVAAQREELAALTAKVKGLPDPQREALVKRELEGRSHEEIATSLGVTAPAVRGLIFRARTALRDGAGMLIPMPVLRTLLGSGADGPEAAGAAGAAAAGLAAGGGGGIAVKAGATLGVAVIAVGSGVAIQHRNDKPADDAAARSGQHHSAGAHSGGGAIAGRLADSRAGEGSRHSGEGSVGSEGHEGSSGPGPGSRSGSESSGEGSGAGDRDDNSEHGGSGSGDDGDDGSGSSSSGSGSSDDDGDSSGSGSSGSGSSGSGSGDGESSGSGSDVSGSGSSGSGSGDELESSDDDD